MSVHAIKYRAIVFDLGGVLLDSEAVHESAARHVASRFRLAVPETTWPRIRGGAYEDFFAHVLSLPANRDACVSALQITIQAYDRYHRDVTTSARLFPFAIDLLELARARFPYVALATSSEWRLADAVLRHFGLAGYFDCVVCGEHLTQKKPAPEAYLVTAWLLGINPASMLVVEDSTHGIRAARLARSRVIGIASRNEVQALMACRAHYVTRDHRELISLVQRLADTATQSAP